jgi:hypothetical protein
VVSHDSARLDEFVRLSGPFALLVRDVVGSPTDGVRVTLTAEIARSVLMRFLRSRVEVADLRVWATVLLGREDVLLDPSHGVELQELLDELALEKADFGLLDAEVWISRLDWT